MNINVKENNIIKFKLDKSYKESIYDNVILKEYTNIKQIKYFIKNIKGANYTNKKRAEFIGYSNEIEQIKKYIEKYDYEENCFKIQLRLPKHRWGRIVYENNASLAVIHRSTRHSLCKEIYVDIDIVNSAPSIISEVCKANNLDISWYKCLKDYVNNRHDYIKEIMDIYGVTRDISKKLFLSILNGGTFIGWVKDYNIDAMNKELPYKVKTFSEELMRLRDYIYSLNSDIIKTEKWDDENKAKKGILAVWYHTIERTIQETIIKYLERKGLFINEIIPCQDGFMILKKHWYDNIIEDCEKEVKNVYGINIKLIKKEFNEAYEIGELEEIEDYYLQNGVKDDDEASKLIYTLYPYWINCEETLYVFDDDTGLWSNKQSTYESIIRRYKDFLYIIKKDSKGIYIKTDKSYGGSIQLMRNIISMLKSEKGCRNNGWLKKVRNTSLGKILFKNGYYDFNTQLFYNKDIDGFNPDIFFVYRINRNFNALTDEDIIYVETIKQRFFYNPLDKETGDYLILNLARALSGEQMKKIFIGIGSTNCGKSVVTKAIEQSLDEYFGTFDAGNLVKGNGSDSAQELRWAFLLQFKRIIFSNEMRVETNLCGTTIKKISSGGDALSGRTHGEEETEFSPHYNAFIMANDMPNILPYDDALDTRLKCLTYIKQFVDEPNNEFELKKDRDIEKEILQERFKNCFIIMLIKAHLEWVESGRIEYEPLSLSIAKSEWITQHKNVIERFNIDHEFTSKIEDYIKSKEIEVWVQRNNLGITMSKFGQEMKKYLIINKIENIKSVQQYIDKKNVQVWIGIKKR